MSVTMDACRGRGPDAEEEEGSAGMYASGRRERREAT